jgi:hypothetical protein
MQFQALESYAPLRPMYRQNKPKVKNRLEGLQEAARALEGLTGMPGYLCRNIVRWRAARGLPVAPTRVLDA